MKSKRVFTVVATVAVILLALWRIGASVYEYQLSVIDRNAPTIPSEMMRPPVFIPDPPPPPPPPVNGQPAPGCYTQDCLARQVIRI